MTRSNWKALAIVVAVVVGVLVLTYTADVVNQWGKQTAGEVR